VRLLLDEHFSPRIARALRHRGYDVAAVSERRDLAGASDPIVLAAATSERCAIVTEDFKDLRPLATDAMTRRSRLPGLICVSRRRLPRGRRNSQTVALRCCRGTA